MALFSIWEGAGDDSIIGVVLKRGDGPPAYADGELMDPDARMVKAFRAASWNEACQVEYDHYGWGEYRYDGNWEEIGPDEE